MREILLHLYEHKTLSREEARTVLTNIASGRYSHSEIASFISVYLMRNITIEELSGFRDALMSLAVRVDLPGMDTIDLCGTGGDEKNTFNISTISSFVVAGAGARVVKHGNYGVTSTCGSSHIMEYFGYVFSSDAGKLKKELDRANLCFLHAPLFNPAMKNVAPVRKELRVKTFFNMLGPMVNPCQPNRQLVGVYNLELVRLYNYLFQNSGKRYVILYSLDGYDEVSLTGPFKMVSREGEKILGPEDLGMSRASPEELEGGSSVKETAGMFLDIMQNKGSADQKNVVVANSGLALWTYYPKKNLEECIDLARISLESGKAYRTFRELIELNTA